MSGMPSGPLSDFEYSRSPKPGTSSGPEATWDGNSERSVSYGASIAAPLWPERSPRELAPPRALSPMAKRGALRHLSFKLSAPLSKSLSIPGNLYSQSVIVSYISGIMVFYDCFFKNKFKKPKTTPIMATMRVISDWYFLNQLSYGRT